MAPGGRPRDVETWAKVDILERADGKVRWKCKKCGKIRSGGVVKIKEHYDRHRPTVLPHALQTTQACIGETAPSSSMPGSSTLPPPQIIQGSTPNAATMLTVGTGSEGPSNPGGNLNNPSNDDRRYQPIGGLGWHLPQPGYPPSGTSHQHFTQGYPPIDISRPTQTHHPAGQHGISTSAPAFEQPVDAAGGAGGSVRHHPFESASPDVMIYIPETPGGGIDLDALGANSDACFRRDSGDVGAQSTALVNSAEQPVPDNHMQDVEVTGGGGSSVPEPSISHAVHHAIPPDESIHVSPMQIDANASNAGNGFGARTINACSDYGFRGADQPRQNQQAIPTPEMQPADSTQHSRQLGLRMDDPVHSGSAIFADVRSSETQDGAGQDVLSASIPAHDQAVECTGESTPNLLVPGSASDTNSVQPQDRNPTRIGRDRDDAGHMSMDSEVPLKKIRLSLPDLVGQNHEKIIGDIYSSLTTEGISRIGVWGMAGAGKTLTLQHLYHIICQNNPDFDVRWVTVSQDCSLRDLQMKIAKATGAPELFKDEDVALWHPLLLQHLEKKKNLVIILDDLWKPFDLKDVVGVPDCVRIVLTARDRGVWERMSRNVERKFKVEPLSKEEAWLLFVTIRGSEPSPEHKPIAEEIVKRCQGLPLAIRVMAASTRRVDTDYGWRYTLTKLKDSKYAQKDMQDDVFPILRYSYDCLDGTKQQCLLRCALYPEDHEIQREQLIELCIDEKVIRGNRRCEMYDEGHQVLDELEKACLLERIVKERRLGTVIFVKMHDLVRGMALNIVDSESYCPYLVKSSLPDKDEWRSNIQKASLLTTWDLKEVRSISPDCPQLSTLLLRHCWGLRKISDCFFEKLPGLKVVDLSGSSIEELPTSIVNLKNLEALLLTDCESLSTLPDSLGELTSLRKLDLCGCEEISEAPRGLEKLVELRYLDLFYTRIARFPDGVIGALVELQYLRIGNGTEVKAAEVAKLKKLEALACRFKKVNELPKTIPKSYKINIDSSRSTDYYQDDFNLGDKSLLLWHVEYAGGNCHLPRDVKHLTILGGNLNISSFARLERLEGLDIRGCYEMLALNGAHDQQQEPSFQPRPDHFPNLKNIWIINCSKLVHLMVGECSCNKHLKKLEFLKIIRCKKLEGLVDTTTAKELPPDSFSQLRVIEIHDCPNLKPVLSTELLSLAPLLSKVDVYGCENMKRLLTLDTFMLLPNLNSISIISCAHLEEAIGQDEHGSTSSRGTNTPLSGPGRLELVLNNLPKLKSICSWSPAIIGRIRVLDVRGCPKMGRIQVLDESPSLPTSLERVVAYPREWWESLEWKHPEAKDALQDRLTIASEPHYYPK